jgi:transcriptional regulator GlxA family with amidase domain
MSLHHTYRLSQWLQPDSGTATEPIDKAISYISRHYAERVSLADLAQAANVSKYNLIRCFQHYRQTTPMKWLLSYRILKAIQFMHADPHRNLGEIAQLTGFCSQSHFSRVFKKQIKMQPLAYKRFLVDDNAAAFEETRH